MTYIPTDDEAAGLENIALANSSTPVVSPQGPPPGFDANGNPLPVGWMDTEKAGGGPVPTPVAPVVAKPNAAPPSAGPSIQGVDYPQYAANVTRTESNNDPNAHTKVPGQTSSGRYGITDGTLESLQKLHPELANVTDKNDPRLLAALTGDNAAALTTGLGRIPSQTDLHAAHFLGAAGAVRFLSANPNTPVTQVVSSDALEANHNVFFDKDNKPYTVGQVYAAAAHQFNGSPQMPAVDPNSPGAKMAQRNPGSYDVASSGNGIPPPPTGAYQSTDSVYGKQQSAIDAYIAQQPQLFQKLSDLQKKYEAASKPTLYDQLDDGLNKYAQASSAAQANQLASAGGILLKANPDATSFISAEQNAHLSDLAARQKAQDVAKTSYDIGTQALSAQNQAQATAIGMTGQLAQQKAQYGLETTKNTQDYNLATTAAALKVAQFGNEQATQLSAYIEKIIPNPETRAKVLADFTANGGNPSSSLAANMAVIDGLVQKAQAGGAQISAKEPAKMMSISTYDPTANGGTGGQKLETVNAATPEGQARLKQVAIDSPNAKITDLGASSTNVNVNSGGEGGGGKNAPAGLAEQHLTAISTANNVAVATTLLDYLEKHGGTGTLTNSDASVDLQKKIMQLTGLDPLKTDARQLYNKVMSQIQTQQTLATMKGVGGRPSDNEFRTMQSGSLGNQATVGAARTYLQHAGALADWNKRSVENQNAKRVAARQTGNQFYDPDDEQIKWQSDPANLPPQWNVDALTAEPPVKTPPPDGSITDPKTGQVFTPKVNGVRTEIVQDPTGKWGPK